MMGLLFVVSKRYAEAAVGSHLGKDHRDASGIASIG